MSSNSHKKYFIYICLSILIVLLTSCAPPSLLYIPQTIENVPREKLMGVVRPEHPPEFSISPLQSPVLSLLIRSFEPLVMIDDTPIAYYNSPTVTLYLNPGKHSFTFYDPYNNQNSWEITRTSIFKTGDFIGDAGKTYEWSYIIKNLNDIRSGGKPNVSYSYAFGEGFKKGDKVPEDVALVYIYRPSKIIGFAAALNIKLICYSVTDLSNGSYYPVFVKPGKIVFSSMYGSATIIAEAGRTYFIRVRMSGPTASRYNFMVVSPDIGEKEISGLKLMPDL